MVSYIFNKRLQIHHLFIPWLSMFHRLFIFIFLIKKKLWLKFRIKFWTHLDHIFSIRLLEEHTQINVYILSCHIHRHKCFSLQFSFHFCEPMRVITTHNINTIFFFIFFLLFHKFRVFIETLSKYVNWNKFVSRPRVYEIFSLSTIRDWELAYFIECPSVFQKLVFNKDLSRKLFHFMFTI